MRILIALLAIAACSNKDSGSASKAVDTPADKPKPVDKPVDTPADKPKPLAEWYQSCWDAYLAKSKTFDDCYADGVVSVQFGFPEVKGKQAILDGHRAWLTAFPDSKIEPQLTLISGRDIFSVRWFHGTHTGAFKSPMGDVPATNKKVGTLVFHHVTVDDTNRVASEQWAFDFPTLAVQLGLDNSPVRPLMDKPWPNAPTTVVASENDAERANAAAVKQVYELFNKRDPKFDDVLADDIVEMNISEPEDSKGKKMLQEHNKMMLGAFKDLRVEVDNVWAAGDYTIGYEHIRATHTGDMGPIKKTGKKLDVNVLEILRWKDGKVVNSYVFLNGLELASQLGLLDKK